jgi:hypothetical protein
MTEVTIEILVIIEPIDANHPIRSLFTINNHTHPPVGVAGGVD